MPSQGKLLNRPQQQSSEVPKRVIIRRISGAAVSFAFPFQPQPRELRTADENKTQEAAEPSTLTVTAKAA